MASTFIEAAPDDWTATAEQSVLRKSLTRRSKLAQRDQGRLTEQILERMLGHPVRVRRHHLPQLEIRQAHHRDIPNLWVSEQKALEPGATLARNR
ncbi:MAG: hypothetical protein ACRD8O_13520 [Bryobacteraceae bacterium]